MSETSIFETYNARHLDPSQVAKTFVPSQHFRSVASLGNHVLVGPRGSGKTTLLKMMQLPALRSWSHAEAGQLRDVIQFVGIFVPADTSWRMQLNALGGDRETPSEIVELLQRSAYTTHVLRAVMDVFVDRLWPSTKCAAPHYMALETTPRLEQTVVEQVARVWGCELQLATFRGLRQALRERMALIHTIANRVSAEVSSPESELAANGFLHVDCLSSVTSGLDIFNDIYQEPDRRWALMVDELEIAPRQIQKSLFEAYRSTDHRLLLKLAISPSFDLETLVPSSPTAPTAGNDLRPVQLWYTKQDQVLDFGKRLLLSVFQQRLDTSDLVDALGPSLDQYGQHDLFEGSSQRYAKGGLYQKAFEDLAKKDLSFRVLLEEKKISMGAELASKDTDPRGAFVRKIAPLAVFRDHYIRSFKDGKPERATRSSPTFYTGYPSFISISEGNPRWLIGMAMELLSRSEEGAGVRFSQSLQAHVVGATSERFYALVRTVPIGNVELGGEGPSLVSLIDKLADYFNDQVLGGKFRQDPYLSFRVDQSVSENVHPLIKLGVNIGALVYLPESADQWLLDDCVGKRFRLSHMLAPHKTLLPRLGRPISLSTVLNTTNMERDETQSDLQLRINAHSSQISLL